jgi:hypothetical protein
VLCVEPLAVWIRGDELLQLRGELFVAPERELRVVEQLERAQPLLRQDRCPGLCYRFSRQVRERRAAPQRECGAEFLGGVARCSGAQRTLRSGDKLVEARGVELPGLDAQPVAGAVRLDSGGAKGLPQAVDVDLQRLDRRPWRVGSPEVIDELVARDDSVRAEQEDSQQRALLRPSERERPVLGLGLDRAQDAEFRGLRPPLNATPSES